MQPNPDATTPSGTKWYGRRWVKAAGLVFAALSVMAAITIVVLFIQWNGRPEKAMFDAIDYALKQPGSYHVVAKNMNIAVRVDGQKYAVDATVDTVPVYLVGDGETLYLKTPQPEQLVEKIVPQSSLDSLRPVISGIVSSSKDKWLEVNLGSQSLNFAIFDQLECATSAKSVLSEDRATRGVVAGAYLAHPFFNFQTTDKQQTKESYTVTIDNDRRKQFGEALVKSDATRTLPECTETPVPVLQNLQVTSLKMDIARPIHHFDKITLNTKDGDLATVTTDYSKQPAIAIPADAVNLDQIANTVFTSMMQTYFKGR